VKVKAVPPQLPPTTSFTCPPPRRLQEFDAAFLKPLFGGRQGSREGSPRVGGDSLSRARSYGSFTDELPAG
jgi:hypothetical protein